MRYAIVNTKTNVVENVIEYDDAPPSPLPGFAEHYIAVAGENASPQDEYKNGGFVSSIQETPLSPSELAKLEAEVLERKAQMPRHVRYFILQDTNHPAYKKARELEDTIVALFAGKGIRS